MLEFMMRQSSIEGRHAFASICSQKAGLCEMKWSKVFGEAREMCWEHISRRCTESAFQNERWRVNGCKSAHVFASPISAILFP